MPLQLRFRGPQHLTDGPELSGSGTAVPALPGFSFTPVRARLHLARCRVHLYGWFRGSADTPALSRHRSGRGTECCAMDGHPLALTAGQCEADPAYRLKGNVLSRSGGERF
jgi:hypothetical protein